jgi:hypothetical protein
MQHRILNRERQGGEVLSLELTAMLVGRGNAKPIDLARRQSRLIAE